MSRPRISAVVASAGAGKTTRIVNDIAAEVMAREPEQIVATTFTVKAADELVERSRAHLFATGRPDKAAQLLGARFGTVNAVCGQIVAEHALDLGRSPATQVVAEDAAARLFSVAADAVVERYAMSLNDLAEAFGWFEPHRNGDAPDWRKTVLKIIGLARANGLDAEGLARSAAKSAETYLALLPPAPPAATETFFDDGLAGALAGAVAALPAEPSKTALKVAPLLRQAETAVRRGEQLSWPNWARLSKVGCAQKDGQALVDALDAVRRWAARHPEHPRLRAQTERFIHEVFACAAEALDAYQAHKAERGLLDFTDQEALALAVLKDPDVGARLRERVGRVFVDEFQDSSPLQVAIFTALADLVDASTWVGDPKQAIYGFRNADSALTQAAFAGVTAGASATADVLSTSYRSRKCIVDLANAAFGPAFAAMGLRPEDHAFSGTARREDGQAAALAVWSLDGNAGQQADALASGVRDALAAPGDWPVAERAGGVRPVQPGDVAVLCRSHKEVEHVAGTLSRAGIAVAVEREGLARTPHVEFVVAALRWTADPSDRLALAELARFFGGEDDPDLWLRAAGAADPSAALLAAVPISDALTELREQVLRLTPAELLDAIIETPDAQALIEAWGDVAARRDDLEALRGFTRNYETECAASGAPATPSGLVLALAAANPKRPKSLRPNAVKVMTYHAAKGLEWPMVVLTGLAREPKPRLFEPVAGAEADVDWRDPLAGRWIRYWPWPYGAQGKDVGLAETALASPLGQAAALGAREEETRLLYVGVTRARDYLVFAPAAKAEPRWLAVLDPVDRPGWVALPVAPENVLRAGDEGFPARVAALAADDQQEPRRPKPAFTRLARPAVARVPLRRRPSGAADDGGFRVAERIELGPRLPIVGAPDMVRLGEAVHAVFAADDAAAPAGERTARASAILGRWGVHEVVGADVVAAVDRLHSYVGKRWPQAQVLRELPIHALVDGQLVAGRIDLLVEHESGFAVFDHKSFPGARDRWDAKATGYGAQLEAYAEAVVAAAGRPCPDLYVHMPVVGALLRLARG